MALVSLHKESPGILKDCFEKYRRTDFCNQKEQSMVLVHYRGGGFYKGKYIFIIQPEPLVKFSKRQINTKLDHFVEIVGKQETGFNRQKVTL